MQRRPEMKLVPLRSSKQFEDIGSDHEAEPLRELPIKVHRQGTPAEVGKVHRAKMARSHRIVNRSACTHDCVYGRLHRSNLLACSQQILKKLFKDRIGIGVAIVTPGQVTFRGRGVRWISSIEIHLTLNRCDDFICALQRRSGFELSAQCVDQRVSLTDLIP